MRDSKGNQPHNTSIYLWPNLVTTAALLSGFSAVLSALDASATKGSSYVQAAVLVFIAMIFDGLDGRVARWTHSESKFGEEYDSLSDLISFGVAPAVIIYLWSLKSLSNSSLNIVADFAWFAAYIYLACAALRLARFNVQIGSVDKRFFVGMPSPTAAAIVVGFVWFCENLGISGHKVEYISLILTLYAGFMMVSNVKFYSFKALPIKNEASYYYLVPIVIILIAIIVTMFKKPGVVIFSVLFLYGLSGPIYTIYERVTRAKRYRKLMKERRNRS